MGCWWTDFQIIKGDDELFEEFKKELYKAIVKVFADKFENWNCLHCKWKNDYRICEICEKLRFLITEIS